MHKNSQSSNYQRGNSFSFEFTMDDVCCIVLLSVLLYLLRGNTFNETDITRFIGSKNPNWTIFTISRTIERRRKCIYNLLKRRRKISKTKLSINKATQRTTFTMNNVQSNGCNKGRKGEGGGWDVLFTGEEKFNSYQMFFLIIVTIYEKKMVKSRWQNECMIWENRHRVHWEKNKWQ